VTDTRTDVCIIGAGPAGLTLALLLVRSGVRVVLVERSQSMNREFRGEILQPGGQAPLHELGVLAPARERGCHEHDRFVLEERGKVLINADYRMLPAPFDRLLSIPQRHLLAALLDECERYDGFTILEGHKVVGLVVDRDRVRGARCGTATAERVVLAECVVGADGRHSKVRRLAGMADGRSDVFGQDVLWFKLTGTGDLPRDVRVFRAGGNPVLAYASHPGAVQLGWCLPHGGYRELAARGFPALKEQLCAAVPHYAERIDAELSGFRQVSILDVFAANAPEWVRDGLLLIGDSAHTFSPIGAQGINLAIQDAVAAHPILVDAVRRNDASTRSLHRFVAARKPVVDRMLKIQSVQSKAMLSTGRVSSAVRPRLAAVVSRTPLFRLMLRQIAYGGSRIPVRTDLFTAGH
jgi:monooxygenase